MYGLEEFFDLLNGEPRSDGRFCQVEDAIYTSPEGNWTYKNGSWVPFHGAPPAGMTCATRGRSSLYVYKSQVSKFIGCMSELAAKLQFAMATNNSDDVYKFVAWVDGVHCFMWDGQEYTYAGTVPSEAQRPQHSGAKAETYDGITYCFPRGYDFTDWAKNGRLYQAKLETLFRRWTAGGAPYVSYPADKEFIDAASTFVSALSSVISDADFPGCEGLVFETGGKAYRHFHGVWGTAANFEKMRTWVKYGGNTLYIPTAIVPEFKRFSVEVGLSLRPYLKHAVGSDLVDSKLREIVQEMKSPASTPKAYFKCPGGTVYVLYETWGRAAYVPNVPMATRVMDGFEFGVSMSTDPVAALDSLHSYLKT